MDAFLKTWYGLTLFIVFDIIAFFAVMFISYNWLFKRLWDIIISCVGIVVLSPILIYIIVTSTVLMRKGKIKNVFDKEIVVGKREKNISLLSFCTTNNENECNTFHGKWLKRTRFYKLATLFDVFLGKLSFIGVKKMSIEDYSFLSDEEIARFSLRPGLINPLVINGYKDIDYEEMLESDIKYTNKYNLFGDIKILLTWLLKCIRGINNIEWMGKTLKTSYADFLLENGSITEDDYNLAKENAVYERNEIL